MIINKMNDNEIVDLENLNEYLLCKLCNRTYDDPIMLPCLHSICSNHVEYTATNGLFECELCKNTHTVPLEGFKSNIELWIIRKLIEIYVPKDSFLGKNNLEAKKLCEKLRQLIERAKVVLKDPSLYLDEYFGNLKATLDLEKEIKIKMIEDNYFRILNLVKEEEIRCLANKCEEAKLELQQTIETTQEILDEWYIMYTDPGFNDEKDWSILRFKMEHVIRSTEYALDKFQSELLLNKDYQFESTNIENENNFGDLNVFDIDFNEDKLEETICFEINNFKSFLSDKLVRFYDEWCVINNLPWIFEFRIEDDYDEEGNYDLALCTYCRVDCDDELLAARPFKAQITFNLFNYDGGVMSGSTEFSYDGSDNANDKFISSLREIMDPQNRIYDIERDSINIEIDIKIINE